MSDLLDVLGAIPVADLSREEWIEIGMALREEGYTVDVWDDWSRPDSRYKAGECRKKWESFRGNANPVKAGTIVEIAKRYGYRWTDTALEWDSLISDGVTLDTPAADYPESPKLSPAMQLATYLEALFRPDDLVGYCFDAMLDGDKWKPRSKGAWLPQKMLVERLRRTDSIVKSIGDYNAEAGGWIRYNPLDGEGVKNDNVTEYRYALVESDSLSLDDQYRKIVQLNLPVVALVASGGKSLHAIVRIDAADAREYASRVATLYKVCANQGLEVDTQNKNPSRLSRMPGLSRGDKVQELLAVNRGPESFEAWQQWLREQDDDLPPFDSLASVLADPPPLAPELICGLLRKGHKMLVSGPSKAGKSFALIELAICISEGWPWLGFRCCPGRVLYINLEIDRASCVRRFSDMYAGIQSHYGHVAQNSGRIDVWNLRGRAQPLDKLAPKLVRRVRESEEPYDAIIVDPIYKVITGSENDASEMAAFCNQFDVIAAGTGCSVIYCHHHSKGTQIGKKAIDRASGSGVFARDPDAILDMTEIELSDSARENMASQRHCDDRAYRIEWTCREFDDRRKPSNVWFHYPLHEEDDTGLLEVIANVELHNAGVAGGEESGRQRKKTAGERRLEIIAAYHELSDMHGRNATAKEVSTYFEGQTGYGVRTIEKILAEVRRS